MFAFLGRRGKEVKEEEEFDEGRRRKRNSTKEGRIWGQCRVKSAPSWRISPSEIFMPPRVSSSSSP